MATISNNATENSQVGIYNDNASNKGYGQTFTMPSSGSITSIQVKHLYDGVGFGHNCTCAIYATSSGLPTGSVLGSKIAVLSGSDVTLTFTLDSSISVNSGTMYAFLIYTGQADALGVGNGDTFANGTGFNWLPGTGWRTLTNDIAGFTITYTEISGPANLKTLDTNAKSNIKTIDGNAIANVKTLDSIT